MQSVREKLEQAVTRLAQEAGVRLPPGLENANGSLLGVAQEAGLCDTAIAAAQAEALGIKFIENLSGQTASAAFVTKVPIGYARQHNVLGLSCEDQVMPVAVADLRSWQPLDVVSRFLGRPVRPVLAPPEQIQVAINRAYQQQSGQAQAHIDNLNSADREGVLAEVHRLAKREDLLDTAGRAPVIKLVNLTLFEAVKEQASDIHIQPYEQRLVVRIRIDGVLFDAFDMPKLLQDEVVSRVKVMGGMNIAEKRLAQDGRATVQVGDRLIDLRISSIPTSFGERIVIRLLDKSARLYELAELGMDPASLAGFRDLLAVEHGLILVTGPTGSGKSTTLYAALQQINSKEKNILTLEDPIEYQLDDISQTQVSDKKGMTFASGLRSVLRQDPDIIMVGEIRDHETAVMAIQSALTGHLVFSTLHTNDAASAVTRLLDLGIEPYLVASSLMGVLAQRLVRRVCPACAQPMDPLSQDVQRVGLRPEQLEGASVKTGVGCEQCRGTGYRGRVGLFELLSVDEAVRRRVSVRDTAAAIKAEAVGHGMRTLQDDGILKILDGKTTVEEVLRVTMHTSG